MSSCIFGSDLASSLAINGAHIRIGSFWQCSNKQQHHECVQEKEAATASCQCMRWKDTATHRWPELQACRQEDLQLEPGGCAVEQARLEEIT